MTASLNLQPSSRGMEKVVVTGSNSVGGSAAISALNPTPSPQEFSLIPLLYEAIMNRKSRSYSDALSSNIRKLVALSIKFRKAKYIKEALHQFRNICLQQHSSSAIADFEQVVRSFTTGAQEKLSQALEFEVSIHNAAAPAMSGIDDLEESETPESLIMRTVMNTGSSMVGATGATVTDNQSGASASVANDDIVMPWMRFLWDAYRTALDLLRNHSKLENLYMEVANEALAFCLKHRRKNEFRRLCDTLRTHLANVIRNQGPSFSTRDQGSSSSQQYVINLSSGNTLQHHLQIRFQQLNAATEMELWQEAFRIIGDIHSLFQGTAPAANVGGFSSSSVSSGDVSNSYMIISPKRMALLKDPYLMIATYYDKLSEIFSVADNYLFHAAALMSLYALVEMHEETLKAHFDLKQIAEKVVLATLAIPIISNATFQIHGELDESRKYRPLMGLLGMTSLVTRTSLLKDIQVKNILERCSANIRNIHLYLEVSFYPLTIGKKMEPLMSELHAHPKLSSYAERLYNVLLTRLLQQLGSVYHCMMLQKLYDLAHVSSLFSLSPAKMETFILHGCRRGEFSAQIDHRQGVIFFSSLTYQHQQSSISSSSGGSSGKALGLAERCNEFCRRVLSLADQVSEIKSANFISSAVVIASREALVLERENLLERRRIIEKRKEQMEAEAQEREKNLEKERQMQVQADMEAERQRQADDLKKREMERMQREMKALEKEECEKMLKEIRRNREAQGLEFDEQEFEGLSKDELIKKHYSRLENERKEMDDRLKSLGIKQDHLERAIRMEDRPLRMDLYKKQVDVDRTYFEEQQKKTIEALKEAHKLSVAKKAHLVSCGKSFAADFEDFRGNLVEERQTDLDALKETLEGKLEAAKQARLTKIKLERKKKLYEAQVAEKAKAEQTRVEALKREEEKRRLAKLEEIAERQRAKEAEIEAREAARRQESKSGITAVAGAVSDIRPEPIERRVDSAGPWRASKTPFRPSVLQQRSSSEIATSNTSSNSDSQGDWRSVKRKGASNNNAAANNESSNDSSSSRPGSGMSGSGTGTGTASSGAYKPPRGSSSRTFNRASSPAADKDRKTSAGGVGGVGGGASNERWRK